MANTLIEFSQEAQEEKETRQGSQTIDDLLLQIPDYWFLASLGEEVKGILIKGDTHERLGWIAKLQHRDGGKLTSGYGATLRAAMNNAIAIVRARKKNA